MVTSPGRAGSAPDYKMFVFGCIAMLAVTTLLNKNNFVEEAVGGAKAKAAHHRQHMLGVEHSHKGLDADDVLREHRHDDGAVPDNKAAAYHDVDPQEDFTPKFPEHMKSIRDSTWHQEHRGNWETQGHSRPFVEGEREKACTNEAATRRNLAGVNAVRDALQNMEDHFPITLNLKAAKQAFKEAMDLDPACATPRLNQLIVLMAEAVTEDDGGDGQPCNDLGMSEKEKLVIANVQKGFDAFPSGSWTPKMFIWRGILEEFIAGRSNTEWYQKAIAMDARLHKEYIHPTFTYPTILLEANRSPAAPMLRRALIQLLFFYEFAPALGAHGKLTYEDVLRFKRDWHLKVKDFFPPYVYFILSRYYGSMVTRNLGSGVSGYKGAGTYESNGDVLNSWLNIKVEEFITRLAGTPVTPTYGYTAGYVKKDILRWHTDRKSCEFTLTLLLVASPNPVVCPLYIQKTPWPIDEKWIGRYEEDFLHRDDVVNVRPQVNELVVIRGRAVPHYRPPLPAEAECITQMLHYVPTAEFNQNSCDTPEQCLKAKK